MTAVVYDNNLENATIILNYEEYKENPDGEIRVYKTRDSFINAMYEEIQANYQKTLGEVLTPKEEINSKKI